MDDLTIFGSGDGSGQGDGSGTGHGSGSGDGSGSGYGSGEGSGFGWGYGQGSGEGSGEGSGQGSGSGSGTGHGEGSGSGLGSGYGTGHGSGSSHGSGLGSSYGSGSGSGYGGIQEAELIFFKTLSGKRPVNIDGILSVFDRRVTSTIVRGFMLRDNWTLVRTFVARDGDIYAHGETSRKALQALHEKILAEMDVEEATETFKKTFVAGKTYPAMDFYNWHGYLTGSCEQGRKEFAEGHGINIQKDTLTPERFFAVVENAYGWDTIKSLADEYKEAKKPPSWATE
jgi:hypothetical protein